MKSYKDYDKVGLGYSDISSLIVRDVNGVNIIEFGADDSYSAYLVDEKANIGSHYELVLETKGWLKIYDDEEIKFNKMGNFKIYQSGGFGIIIQKLEDKAL